MPVNHINDDGTGSVNFKSPSSLSNPLQHFFRGRSQTYSSKKVDQLTDKGEQCCIYSIRNQLNICFIKNWKID